MNLLGNDTVSPGRLCSHPTLQPASTLGCCLAPDLNSLPPPILPTSTLTMSTTKQTTGPLQLTDGFTAVFKAAESEYQRITEKPLDTHPFAKKLRICDNPQAVSNLFRNQADVFSKFCEGDKKLMALLDPTIHILFAFSDTLGDVIGLVRHFIRSCVVLSQRLFFSYFRLQKLFSPVLAFFSP